MMIKILCLLQTAKSIVKHMAFMLLHDLKGINEKGWPHTTNARGSTRSLTTLKNKDLYSKVK